MEVKTISTADIAPGKMIGIEQNGTKILIANVDGKFYAIGNVCMHQGCTVSEGTLTGNNAQCPCHGSTYDVRTGAVITGPARKPEPSYKVKVRGDELIISV